MSTEPAAPEMPEGEAVPEAARPPAEEGQELGRIRTLARKVESTKRPGAEGCK